MHEGLGSRRTVQSSMQNVADNANDLGREGLIGPAYRDPFSKWIFVRPKATRHCCIYNGHTRSLIAVRTRESPSTQEGNAKRAEIIGCDDCLVGSRLLTHLRRLAAFDYEWVIDLNTTLAYKRWC